MCRGLFRDYLRAKPGMPVLESGGLTNGVEQIRQYCECIVGMVE